MVDTSKKVQKVILLIDEGMYFTINRPRQYGKTTTLYMLERALKDRYLLISTSFEGLGEEAFENVSKLSGELLNQMVKSLKVEQEDKMVSFIRQYKRPESLSELSNFMTDFVNE